MSTLSRIATNVGAMKSLNALNKVNNDLQATQLRLATGQRINSASEDAAGWVIGKNMEARSQGLGQALSNVADAQSLLGVAEGGLQSVLDILITMKGKVTQAANDTLGSSERAAIESQLDSLAAEIDSIVDQTTFNDVALLDGTYTTKSFQVGSETTDTMTISISSKHTAASLSVADSDLDVTSAANASTALSNVDTAIDTVNASLREIGSVSSRLDFKTDALNSILSNTESAKSTILDADFASEQVNAIKLQILQQTATSALSQANTSPQAVLSLF
jgi:flagellin